VGHSLDFVYNPKTSIQKSIKGASKPSKPTILAKQAKPSKLKVSKIASQQAEPAQLGSLDYPQLCFLPALIAHPISFNGIRITCSL
jgi:hypothetical protein